MAIHKGEFSRPDETFLLQTLNKQIGQHLYPVHRLDKATSGVVVFGLEKKAAAALQASMQDVSARKEYTCVVRSITPRAFETSRPLTDAKGLLQPARSFFVRLQALDRASILRARIFTGRTHQIRRHLDHLAFQILGDTTHGKGRINKLYREKYGLPRLALHASRMRIAHPITGEPLELHARLPEDLRTFLLALPGIDTELTAKL